MFATSAISPSRKAGISTAPTSHAPSVIQIAFHIKGGAMLDRDSPVE
jgi:hypothetical protein